MKLPKNRALFSIKEMSEICGISRASLLRLEEDGFLLPYRVNPDTGYRYYDMQNVTAVGQYQRMQTIGMSRKEIADLYYERIDSAAFIAELRQKLARLQLFLNEYEMRHDRSKNFSVFYTALPAVTCSVMGGWLGAKLALTKGARLIRRAMIAVLLLMTVRLAAQLL